jgi:hypothetical protein
LVKADREAPVPVDPEVVEEACEQAVPIRVFLTPGAINPASMVLFRYGLECMRK